MKIKPTSLIAYFIFFGFIGSLYGKTIEFKIPTKDGKTSLTGQLDLPEQNSATLPMVVMMPGTGLFNRDVIFSVKNGPGSYLFKDLAKLLNEKGVATLRFDYRGVRYTPKAELIREKSKNPFVFAKYFHENCVNGEIRKEVTPENIRSDLEEVYKWGLGHANIDPGRIVVFAHSEGSIHVSHLVAEKKINPTGIVLMGGLFASPKETIRWQMVDRVVNALKKADINKDGKISHQEIKTEHKSKNSVLSIFPVKALLPEADFYQTDSLKKLYENEYQEVVKQYTKKADNEIYPNPKFPQASMRWWKMFFLDQVRPVKLYANSKVPVINHIGTKDSQIDLSVHLKALTEQKNNESLFIFIHPGKGHSLGQNALLGPLDNSSKRILIDSILHLVSLEKN